MVCGSTVEDTTVAAKRPVHEHKVARAVNTTATCAHVFSDKVVAPTWYAIVHCDAELLRSHRGPRETENDTVGVAVELQQDALIVAVEAPCRSVL